MAERVVSEATSNQDEASQRVEPPGIDWNDPQVPVGDAPPVSHWPLVVSAVCWFAWVAFLVATLFLGLDTPYGVTAT